MANILSKVTSAPLPSKEMRNPSPYQASLKNPLLSHLKNSTGPLLWFADATKQPSTGNDFWSDANN